MFSKICLGNVRDERLSASDVATVDAKGVYEHVVNVLPSSRQREKHELMSTLCVIKNN